MSHGFTSSTAVVPGQDGWTRAYELDLTNAGTQTLSTDTTYTISSKTWTKVNSTNDNVALALTSGTGLVFQPKSTSDYNGSTRTLPMLGLPLTSAISNFSAFRHAVRVWAYVSASNMAANFDSWLVGLDPGDATVALYAKMGKTTGGNGVGRAIHRATTNVGFNNHLTTAVNTYNVMVVEAPMGVYGGVINTYTGTYSSGFPAESALRISTPYSDATPTAPTDGHAANATWYLQLGAQRAASVTALSITFARLRVEYRTL